jgi:hypothetical protein
VSVSVDGGCDSEARGLRGAEEAKARTGEFSDGLTEDAPNAVWGADFKGWFRLSTGAKGYPLTVSDGYSRYLLCCDALAHPDPPLHENPSRGESEGLLSRAADEEVR